MDNVTTRTLALVLLLGPTSRGGAQEAEAPPPLEPATVFDADPWYETWWHDGSRGLGRLPAETAASLQAARQEAARITAEGIRAGDTTVIPAAGQNWDTLRRQAGSAAAHHQAAVVDLPEHGRQAVGHLQEARRRVNVQAQARANHTAAVAREEQAALERGRTQSRERLHRLDQETNQGTRQASAQADAARREAWRDGTHEARTALGRANQDASQTAASGLARAASRLDSEGGRARARAQWTAEQVPEGASRTVADTGEAARGTARAARELTGWTRRHATAASDTWAQDHRQVQEERARVVTDLEVAWREEEDQAHQELDSLESRARARTVARLRPALAEEAQAARRDARDIWRHGHHDLLQGGVTLAEDNLFAGDARGTALAAYYALTGVTGGAGYVVIFQPLAASAHAVTAGLTAAGLSAGALTAVSSLAAAHHLASVGYALRRGTDRLTTLALFDVVTRGYLGVMAGQVLGVTGLGLLLAGNAWAVGATHLAATAAWDVTRTLALTTWGIMGLTVGGPLLLVAGTAGDGLSATLGPLALAGLGGARASRSLAHGAATGTAATLEGGATVVRLRLAEALTRAGVPLVGLVVLAARSSRVAGHALVDNLLFTPVSSMALAGVGTARAGWSLVGDAANGTLEAVTGVGGFAARQATLGAMAASTGALGGGLAVARAGVGLAYHGGKSGVSAAARGADQVTAPFRFDRQNAWKAQREPTLAQLLQDQPREVRESVGTQVKYVRVVFSGPDRGKVNFFTTEGAQGKHRFHRRVGQDCAVTYVSATARDLHTGTYDGRCLQETAHDGRKP